MWLPAVKSVCALGLLAKNTPPPKPMCCSPSLSALSWVPNSPCMMICISLPRVKQTVCMVRTPNFCVQKCYVWDKLHIAMCVQASLPVSMRAETPAAPLITMANCSSAWRNHGGRCLLLAKSPPSFWNLPFIWVFFVSAQLERSLWKLYVRLRESPTHTNADTQTIRHNKRRVLNSKHGQIQTRITEPWELDIKGGSKTRNICSMV